MRRRSAMPDPALHARLAEILEDAWLGIPDHSNVWLAVADALLASEEWQAREKVVSLMTLVALRAYEWPKCMWFAGWLSRQESLEIGEALARLAAVRGEHHAP